MYMDDIKQFAKNEKELETLIQTIIYTARMFHAYNENRIAKSKRSESAG